MKIVLNFYDQCLKLDASIAFIIKIVVNVVEKFHHLLMILEMIYIEISYDLNMLIDLFNRSIDNDSDFNLRDLKMIFVDYHLVMYLDFSNASCEIHVIDERE